MDWRKCVVCETEFDFDTSGLQGPNKIVVCGNECAKKSAQSRGREHLITDNEDKIVETNMTPGLKKVWY